MRGEVSTLLDCNRQESFDEQARDSFFVRRLRPIGGRPRENPGENLARRKYPCLSREMVARVDGACRTLACGAVLLIAFGCGGTTLSKDDGSTQGGDAGSTACTLLHEGDIVVRTPAELDALRDHLSVSGDLIVKCPTCTTLAPLACLEEVGKMLTIVGCDELESLDGLSALRRIGLRQQQGGLAIGFHFEPGERYGNARLRTLDGLGPLEFVQGRVDVRENPQLADLSGLSGLTRIAGSLFVTNNDALPSLGDLRELASLLGTLEIEDNDALVDLAGLGSLVQTTGLGVRGNDALTTLGGLDQFWGQSSDLDVDISDNPLLSDVTALENLQGTVDRVGFKGNASLGTVTLNPALSIISGGLVIRDNARLEAFSATGLTHVATGLEIEKNPMLTTLALGAPVSIGSLFLRDNGSLRDTSALAEVRLVERVVTIENNALLERVTLPELQTVGGTFAIRSNAVLAGFDLGALRRAESIQLLYNERLPSCLARDLLSSVVTTDPSRQCDNSLDECVNECPPPP
jgi:hypothetical protein